MRVDGSNLPPLSSFVGGCARLTVMFHPSSSARVRGGSNGETRLNWPHEAQQVRPVGKAANPQDTRTTPGIYTGVAQWRAPDSKSGGWGNRAFHPCQQPALEPGGVVCRRESSVTEWEKYPASTDISRNSLLRTWRPARPEPTCCGWTSTDG